MATKNPMENTCTCDNLKKYDFIDEKPITIDADSKKVNKICLPLCPYCLGYINGVIDRRIVTIDKNKIKSISALSNDYLLDDYGYMEAYEKGYESGFNFTSLKDAPTLTESNITGGFKVIASEFGETYHLAVAMLCAKNIRADLSNASDDQIIFFYSIFQAERLKVVDKSGSWLPKDISTDILCGLFPKASENAKIFDCKQSHEKIFLGLLMNFLLPKSHANNLKQSCINYITNLGFPNNSDEKVIVWIRSKKDGSALRNLYAPSLKQIVEQIRKSGINSVILMGDPINSDLQKVLDGYGRMTFYNLTEFHKRPGFKLLMGNHKISGQLFFLKILQTQFNVKLAIGMMSGALDGPAFIGLPIIMLTTESPNNRIPAASTRVKTMVCVHYDKEEYVNKKQFNMPDLVGESIAQIRQDIIKPEVKSPETVRRYIKKMQIVKEENTKYFWTIGVIIVVLIGILMIALLAVESLSRISGNKTKKNQSEPSIDVTGNTYNKLINDDFSQSESDSSSEMQSSSFSKSSVTFVEEEGDYVVVDDQLHSNEEEYGKEEKTELLTDQEKDQISYRIYK